jgi:hypothetical protein
VGIKALDRTPDAAPSDMTEICALAQDLSVAAPLLDQKAAETIASLVSFSE